MVLRAQNRQTWGTYGLLEIKPGLAMYIISVAPSNKIKYFVKGLYLEKCRVKMESEEGWGEEKNDADYKKGECEANNTERELSA